MSGTKADTKPDTKADAGKADAAKVDGPTPTKEPSLADRVTALEAAFKGLMERIGWS